MICIAEKRDNFPYVSQFWIRATLLYFSERADNLTGLDRIVTRTNAQWKIIQLCIMK
jgi:hypothetical protein